MTTSNSTDQKLKKLIDLLAERDRNRLPIWVRADKERGEHFTSLTRAKLYDLASRGKIRSISLREPGRQRGCRLFHLPSIIAYIEGCEPKKDVAPAEHAESSSTN